MTQIAELVGLVFVVDYDDIEHNTEQFKDELFRLGFIKEVDGPFINGIIAITVDVERAIKELKLPYLIISKIIQKIETLATKTANLKKHKE